MHYQRFQDLPVWNAAIDLADKTFKLCDDRSFDYQGDLRRQLGKAALSVSNNIAEGFERNTAKELKAFLYIARGSNGELRSMLYVLERNERYAHLAERREEIMQLAASIGRQLKGWVDNLESSIIERKPKEPIA